MRDLDLKTLRLFVAVCDTGNIARAAEQEHIEPSAISKRIAQLEATARHAAAGARAARRGADAGRRRAARARAHACCSPSSAHRARHGRLRRRHHGAGAAGGDARRPSPSRCSTTSPPSCASPAHRDIKVDIEERFSRDLVRGCARAVRRSACAGTASTSRACSTGPTGATSWPSRCTPTIRWRASAIAALRADARLRARRPAAVDGGAHDAAARGRARPAAR